jgi:hypothetical protein
VRDPSGPMTWIDRVSSTIHSTYYHY